MVQEENLAAAFKQRFIKEYLPTLQARQKWHRQREQLRVGDLVFMVGDSLARGKYPLARVTETFPDEMGMSGP